MFQAEAVPQCTVQPRRAQEVANALGVVRKHGCKFAVLGGGTSPFRGASNAHGGVTFDLRRMNNIEFSDPEALLLSVGGGTLWADVYSYLDPRNLSATGTRNSLTGVAGSVLGGKWNAMVESWRFRSPC